MHDYVLGDNLLKILTKIAKKDKGLYEKILKKNQ
jgi:hypothetical protein